MSEPPTLFTLRGKWPKVSGNATYHCATREQAIKKLEEFIGGGYTDIEIIAADGSRLTEAELKGQDRTADAPAGAPVVPDALPAPALA